MRILCAVSAGTAERPRPKPVRGKPAGPLFEKGVGGLFASFKMDARFSSSFGCKPEFGLFGLFQFPVLVPNGDPGFVVSAR
jgi:hypothetical protein